MALTLKCPNPSCSYLFDPATVPAGVVLACPRCAMRFTLGTPAAPPPPGHHPQNELPSDTNLAFSGLSTATPRDDAGGWARLPVRGSRLQMFLLVLVAAVALAGAAVAVRYKLTHKPEDLPPDLSLMFKEKNLSVEGAPGPWVRDEDMRVSLG